jgi:hypothetical protein
MLEDMARRTGLKWKNAAAGRCRGLLADEKCYEQEFETALALYGEDMGFERARTQLVLRCGRRAATPEPRTQAAVSSGRGWRAGS